MRRFRFRLERVLGARRTQEEATRRRWQMALAALQRARERVGLAREAISTARVEIARLLGAGRLHPGEILVGQRAEEALSNELARALSRREERRAAARERRDVWSQERRRVEGLERLRERHLERHRRQERRDDSRGRDEIVLARFGRAGPRFGFSPSGGGADLPMRGDSGDSWRMP